MCLAAVHAERRRGRRTKPNGWHRPCQERARPRAELGQVAAVKTAFGTLNRRAPRDHFSSQCGFRPRRAIYPQFGRYLSGEAPFPEDGIAVPFPAEAVFGTWCRPLRPPEPMTPLVGSAPTVSTSGLCVRRIYQVLTAGSTQTSDRLGWLPHATVSRSSRPIGRPTDGHQQKGIAQRRKIEGSGRGWLQPLASSSASPAAGRAARVGMLHPTAPFE